MKYVDIIKTTFTNLCDSEKKRKIMLGLRQLYKNRSEMYVFYDEKYDSNKKLLICTKMYKKNNKTIAFQIIKICSPLIQSRFHFNYNF